MLEVADLHAGYGGTAVLRGVGFTVQPGEIVCLLGRNGVGRSTTLKALMGLVPAKGSVRWRGRSLLGEPAHRIARLGIGYVPESRDVFPRLTVLENLRLGIPAGGAVDAAMASERLEAMLTLFPPLRERLRVGAGVLSGGEQQMLALARTLMGGPRLVLVDEPTEGLAPQIVERVAACLHALPGQGTAVLLVEQKLAIALEISHRCLVLGHGRIVFEGTPQALRAQPALLDEWLAV